MRNQLTKLDLGLHNYEEIIWKKTYILSCNYDTINQTWERGLTANSGTERNSSPETNPQPFLSSWQNLWYNERISCCETKTPNQKVTNFIKKNTLLNIDKVTNFSKKKHWYKKPTKSPKQKVTIFSRDRNIHTCVIAVFLNFFNVILSQ